MRRPRPWSSGDLDVVDVLILDDEDEDVAADEVRAVLHELALEAVAWRATWPGEPERLLWSEATAEDAAPPDRARRYRRRAVTAALLALAVAATTAVVDARQTAARADALAALPAVLTEVTDPPAEVWQVPGRVVSDQHDVLLVVDGASLRAIDPATGEATWTAPDEAGRAASRGGCFPVDERLMPGRAPVDDGAGPPGLLACTEAPGAGDPAGDPALGSVGSGVVVVDAATGRITQTITVDGALLLAEPVGRDLLVATAWGDGRVRVTRWDLATRSPRWDGVSPEPVLTGGAAHGVERRADSVTVGAYAVDLASGAALDAEEESTKPYPYEEHALPGGARATFAWERSGTSGRGRVSGGSAASAYMLPGPPLRPPVTDGWDAGRLVVPTARGDRLRGLDLRTGRMEWSQPHPGASTLSATALVDGVMLLTGDDTVTALDVRTGGHVWRTHVDAGATGGTALTDGQVVLLPVRADDGALELVAHRFADGTEVWRTRAPAGTESLTVVDHQLVASTGDTVIGLD